MKKQIVQISILQSSKIVTVLYAIFGLIYTLIGIPMIIFGSGPFRLAGVLYTAMPILMAILGFIFFCIFGLLYNFLAERLGGFEFEVRDIG